MSNWVKTKDKLPVVIKNESSFSEYNESELVLVAFKHRDSIMYEIAKFTKGRDTTEGEYWHSWYCPAADDCVDNVIAWMPFEKFNEPKKITK